MGHLRVIAYIFKDGDLLNNLMGLAPFADRNCKAVFKATSFSLYHVVVNSYFDGREEFHQGIVARAFWISNGI